MLAASYAAGQGVKRLVIIKLDGVAHYYVDQFVQQKDPKTGRSVLPWFDEVFYKNGTRLPNFYSRGMSLSGPAWGQIATGQHLQIKGNVEFDRFTLKTNDYLALVPFFTKNAFGREIDTPAAQILDQLRIPLLQDAFDRKRQYTSNQLYQRGINWGSIGGGFVNKFPRDKRDLIDEWTLGIDLRDITVEQNERDIIGKLEKRPQIDYYDYYSGTFDHVSHANADTATRLESLKKADQTIGRIWLAIQSAPRADETALIVVSDHGFNSEPGVYSQGFNLVRLLGSTEGGGHHVGTMRRLMLDYSIKGINPYINVIKTASKDSYYLKGQNDLYPTALLDFDGNERSSLHLRNSDLNTLHILLQQLKDGGLSSDLRAAATRAVFAVIDRHRAEWEKTVDEMSSELAALRRWNDEQARLIAALPKKFTPEEIVEGVDDQATRLRARARGGIADAKNYGAYLTTLENLLALKPHALDPKKLKIETLIAPGSMGDANSVYDLQNYVVGPSARGLQINAAGELDMTASFARVNYFDLLKRQRVKNVVQPKLGNEPIDFVAVRIPQDQIADALTPDQRSDQDAIWLYGGTEAQALVLSRTDPDGRQSYRYLPVSALYQEASGKFSFQQRDIAAGFPLRMFEDAAFAVPVGERAEWFAAWHSEHEWLKAAHMSRYSNAVIDLNEQLDRHEPPNIGGSDRTEDERLIDRFRIRQRNLREADMLILANDHWNFDVRGFNPGGNHGSFFRVSTNSIFMLAGGANTGIPRGLEVTEPYDSLSVIPTIFRLMGRLDANNEPDAELRNLGFRKFPGRVVKEVTAR